MPTDQQIDASEQTVETTPPVQSDIPEDAVKAHPLFKDLQTKHAAARTGMDDANKELKKLKKALVGDEEVKAEPEVTPATTNALQSLKDELKWELKNEKSIELANQNGLYDKYVAEGRSKYDALKLALFDEGITNSAAKAESMRQAQTSTPNPGFDRSSGDEPTADEKEQMKLWGYSLETLRKHKELRQR